MRRTQYTVILSIALIALVLSIYYGVEISEKVTPSPAGKTRIPAPDNKQVMLFFHSRSYAERISGLPPNTQAILSKYSRDYELKPFDENAEVLPVKWKPGSLSAMVPVRINDFPRQGVVGFAKMELVYTNTGWHFDIYESEPGFLPQLVNVYEHPLGLLTAYFGTVEATVRKLYVIEEVARMLDPGRRTPFAEGIPFSEWKLLDVEKLSINGNIAQATVRIESVGGTKKTVEIRMRTLLKKWLVWRDAPKPEAGRK